MVSAQWLVGLLYNNAQDPSDDFDCFTRDHVESIIRALRQLEMLDLDRVDWDLDRDED